MSNQKNKRSSSDAELSDDVAPQRQRAGSSDPKPLLKELPAGVEFFSLMNSKRNFFIPSTKNYFGRLKIKELKCDSGCNSMLLPINEISELLAAFPCSEYKYDVKTGNGTAGRTLALTVRHTNFKNRFSINIASDLIETQQSMTYDVLRFSLCQEDKLEIIKNPSLFRLKTASEKKLADNDISRQTRRTHGLLGQSVLSQMASIKYQGCELYVNPAEYKFPENFETLDNTITTIKDQLVSHLPSDFDDWEDDDFEYEDDEREED